MFVQLFDLRSFVLVIGLANIIMCCGLFYTRLHLKTYAGFLHWAMSMVCGSCGLVLIGLRLILPDFITVILANVLLVISATLLVLGIGKFYRLRFPIWPLALLNTSFCVAFGFFTYVSPSISVRILLSSIALAGLYGYAGWLVRNANRRGGVESGLQVLLGLQAALFVGRFGVTLFNPPVQHIENAPGNFLVAAGVFLVGNMLTVFSLILANFSRIEREMLKMQNEVQNLRTILPICSACKKIRSEEGVWQNLEVAIGKKADVDFSHSYCPDCVRKLYPEDAEEVLAD